MAQLKSTSVTGNLSVTGNVVASTKMIQGAYNADATINEMNQFNTDLFISGNGSSPDKPTIPGIYLGKSSGDENRHIDIVAAHTPDQAENNTSGYIDFSKAGTSNEDYRVRLIANVDTGFTQFQWNNNIPNVTLDKTLKLDGGTLEAENIKVTSANLNSGDYDRIYVGNNECLQYRTKAQFINDLDLSHVYNYKGTITWAELKNIAAANVGDVYHISDADPSGKTATNWACKAAVTAATGNNYATYWQSIGNTISLSGYVTKDTDQIIAGKKTFSEAICIKDLSQGSNVLNLQGEYGNYNFLYTGNRESGNFTSTLTLQCVHKGASTSTGWQVNQDGQMGIGTGADSRYRLIVDGGDTYISNGKMGIGTAPNSNYRLTVNGDTYISNGLLKIANTYDEITNILTLGSQNSEYCHIYNSENIPFLFNNTIAPVSMQFYNSQVGHNVYNKTDLGTTDYPWDNILFKGALQFYQGAGENNLRTEFKYNTNDKCIDVIFH